MFDWIPIFVVYENQNFLLGIDLCFFSSLVLSQIIIHKSTTITKYTSQILKINVKPSNLDRTKIWQFHEIIFSKKNIDFTEQYSYIVKNKWQKDKRYFR